MNKSCVALSICASFTFFTNFAHSANNFEDLNSSLNSVLSHRNDAQLEMELPRLDGHYGNISSDVRGMINDGKSDLEIKAIISSLAYRIDTAGQPKPENTQNFDAPAGAEGEALAKSMAEHAAALKNAQQTTMQNFDAPAGEEGEARAKSMAEHAAALKNAQQTTMQNFDAPAGEEIAARDASMKSARNQTPTQTPTQTTQTTSSNKPVAYTTASTTDVAALESKIAADRQAQAETNQQVADNSAELVYQDARLSSMETSTNNKFSDLNKRIDKNAKKASAGIAGVAAMANIPQVIQGQTFSVGAGAGNTEGESAVALGFSARATENIVVKSAISTDTQHNFVMGAGVSYGL
ncbi:YadA C-terminal domain-containing protein [Enterobacter bugandensis]